MADNTSQKAIKSAEKSKYPNAINRTTSESLRLGDSDKVISHPTTLSSNTTNAKKKTSFQITSVTVGSRISNDGGDDSADDLDESHTDDISRVTDIENETPSYSEDTFSKDDVFFNTSASASLGSAPVIPTSSQYGLAIVANENCVNPSLSCGANNISGDELHVTVTDNVINLVGVKHNETEMRELHSHTGRNERFKVVKIESTEPFRRGRWMCMDYLDHSMIQQQQSQSNISNQVVKENCDLQNLNAQQTATDSGISVSDIPPVSTVDDQVPCNVDKGTQEQQQYTTMNPNAGQTAPGGFPSVSPGQTMQAQVQPQVLQQHSQSVSLNTPVQQTIINSNQHQSLQAQQLQQAMTNIPVQQQPVQVAQQQMQSQPIQMQPIIQQSMPQQSTPQQVTVSQQMSAPQPVQLPPQQISQIPPQQHIPQQQIHSMPISNQQMQVPQSIVQQIPQQPIQSQIQPPQSYQQPTATQQSLQQHMQQAMHQMAAPLQQPMTQNQASPQAYQQNAMQQCPPGLSPQQMMSVPQHQLPPQPQYYTTPQGIPMMTQQGQQQNQMLTSQGQPQQMMTAPGQQGQMIPPQSQQGQMMTSQGQMITIPQVPLQSTVPIQPTYSVTNMTHQQQSQPPQQQQQTQPPQQQTQPQQMSIGHSGSMHHVPNASIATSVAGYVPVVTGQSVPTPVSQPNPVATAVAGGSSQTTPTVIPQQCYMMPQGTGQALYANSSVPSNFVEAISDPIVMERMVQSAHLLESLAEVTSAPEESPIAGEEAESLGGLARALAVSRKSSSVDPYFLVTCPISSADQPQTANSASGTSAVAIDNKIEQAMDLVKSHLMFAVREEVEVLKEKIAELMDRINHLEVENTILKANASQETLAQLSNLPAPPSSNNAP